MKRNMRSRASPSMLSIIHGVAVALLVMCQAALGDHHIANLRSTTSNPANPGNEVVLNSENILPLGGTYSSTMK